MGGEEELQLDLVSEQEIQGYNILKDRLFIHTLLYDDALLAKIGMDSEFFTIWKAVCWENIDPISENGSHPLTIQFLCTMSEVDSGITFCLFGTNYNITWKEFSLHLGFNRKCSLDLDHAVKGFNRHNFWEDISGQAVTGKLSPRNAQIQHPTLRFMHHWIAMTLFPSQDIRVVRNDELKLLYAIRKKIKVAPVKEIFRH